jgi:predicted nucleic acid-binding protein
VGAPPILTVGSKKYRKRGGEKKAPLPDFYIGAHAAIAGFKLLTRDVARYRTYFPTIEIIAPESNVLR